MTARNRTYLRDFFIKALKPRQEQFVDDFMDSFYNINDDEKFDIHIRVDSDGSTTEYEK